MCQADAVAHQVEYMSAFLPSLTGLHAARSALLSLSVTNCRAAASWQLPGTVEPGSNLAVVQVTATLPFEVNLRFLSGHPVAQLTGSTQQQAALSGQLRRSASCAAVSMLL